jgi:hypothetical protein
MKICRFIASNLKAFIKFVALSDKMSRKKIIASLSLINFRLSLPTTACVQVYIYTYIYIYKTPYLRILALTEYLLEFCSNST